MTPTEREEGRRLLDEFDNAKPPVQSHVILSLEDWLWEHKKSLLADHENISRAVVRELDELTEAAFHVADVAAETQGMMDALKRAGLSHAQASLGPAFREQCQKAADSVEAYIRIRSKLAAARGVTLEKP